jgi:zinc protease
VLTPRNFSRAAPWLALALAAPLLAQDGPTSAPDEAAPAMEVAETTEVVIPDAPAAPATPGEAEAPAPKAAPQDGGLVRFHELENGLSVVLEPSRPVPSVSLQLWLHTGYSHEGPGERGSLSVLAELLRLRCETAMLEGSPALRAAAGQVTTEVERDALMLGLEGPSGAFEDLLRTLARAVRGAQVEANEFHHSRALAGERLRHLRADGNEVVRAAMYALAFRVHPYRHHPVTATRSLANRRREEVEGFLARTLVPERASLVVVGKVDRADAARAIIQELGDWRRSPRPTRPKIVEPKLVEPRLGTIVSPDEVSRLGLGFVAPAYRSDDAPVVALLAQLLDPSSRTTLARGLLRLLPEGSGLRVDYVPSRDPSLFTIEVRGRDLKQERLVRRLLAAFDMLRETGVRPEDLDLAKRRLEARALARTQSHADQARALGLTRVLAAPEAPRPLLERVLALTPGEIQEAARRYLTPEAFVGVGAVPRPPEDRAAQAEVPRPDVATRPSGLRVAQAALGGSSAGVATVRLRLTGLRLSPGEIAGLRRAWLHALSRRPDAGPWEVTSPAPGLDRDALSFSVTAPGASVPDALADLVTGLASTPLDARSAPPHEGFAVTRDRAVDAVLTQLLEGTTHGVARHGPKPAPSRLDELRATLLQPERLVLALSRGIDKDAAASALERVLEDVAPSTAPPTEPALPAPSRPLLTRADVGDAVVVLATRAAGARDEGLAGAQLLAQVLGGGPGSRLGRRLREVAGLGFETGVRHLPLEGGPGVLVAWIGCSPENRELAELVLREEATRLTVEPVSADELMAAREALRQARVAGLQNPTGATSTLARQVHRGTLPAESPGLVDALTLLDQARESFADARVAAFSAGLLAAVPSGEGASEPPADAATDPQE